MQTLIHNVLLATMDDPELGLQPAGAVLLEADTIRWCGAAENLPENLLQDPVTRIDGQGQLLTPGLIDCHTHLAWAGSRAEEFRQRLHGTSYAEIAAAGGGILSTVKATRAASEQELLELNLPRARALLQQGVTRLEIKSGYGLTLEDELKQLRVAREIGRQLPLTVHTTLLAAHALPPEYKDQPDAYVDYICDTILPAAVAKNLADAVDVFCEHIGFSRAQTERIFARARDFGLPVKLHAEQLSDQDGAALCAAYEGLSADHLEYLSPQGIAAMAKAGTVAVLLPGAFYFLRETKYPPLAELKEAGVPIALATDANPGSSPLMQLPLMMHMGCTLFRLTPEQSWLGVTRHAAQALGCAESAGVVQAGAKADLALWDITEPAQLCYEHGVNHLARLWQNGQEVAL